MKKTIGVLLTVILLFSFMADIFADSVEEPMTEPEAQTTYPAGNPEEVAAVILHTNDVHVGYQDNIGYDGLELYKKELESMYDHVLLVDAGSVRTNLLAGEVTYQDIVDILPYCNEVVTARVSGRMILDALEFGVSFLPEKSGGFPQVSGITFRIDPEVESSVKIDEKKQFLSVEGERRVSDVMINGRELDPDGSYTFAITLYLLTGGDGYTMFQDSEIINDTMLADNEAVMKYIEENLKGEIPGDYADPQGRIQQTVSMTFEEYMDQGDEAWFLTGKNEYNVQAMMVSKETSFHNELEVTDYTATEDGTTVILKGRFDEMWTTKLPKVISTYTKPDGSTLCEADFARKDSWIDIITKPEPDAYFAMHVPLNVSVTVETAWGDTLHTNLPNAPHGDGDYLVCRVGEDGKPDLSDVWVLNGMVFPEYYDTSRSLIDSESDAA